VTRRHRLAGLLLALLGCATAAGADPVSPRDFAYGAPLEVAGDRPVQAVELPARVYGVVTRADLGDLRVFNAAGEVVPYAVDRVPRTDRPDAAPVPVPFFPLGEPDGESRDGEPSVSVRAEASGTLVEVRRPGGRRDRMVRGVLLDLTGLGLTGPGGDALGVEEIVVEFEPDAAGTPDFLAAVTVESSDDLSTWRPWGGGTLARLRYGGSTLRRDDLRLPPRRARYARLVWPRGTRAPEVAGVRVTLARAGEPELRWERLEGESPEPHVFVFDQAGVLAVERARLDLPQVNTLARVTLSSAADPRGPWRRRVAGTVYRLRHEGHELTAPPLELPATTDRYWRLEVDPAGGGLGRQAPVLELGWRPERLLFVARGEGPFTLAFGSAGTKPAGLAPAVLLDPEGRADPGRRPRVARARLGEVTELGGADRLTAAREIPWTRVVLWVVLVAAVAGLGWMVVGLLRETR
jgi:hypothetical protein